MSGEEEGYCFLVEIVSCRDIPIGDRTSSDPYVHVKTGSNKNDIHKTKHILKTLNPTFTSETNNAFILSCSKSDLYNSEGLLFKVKDWDRIGSDEELGYIQISPDTLLQVCNDTERQGFPQEFKLSVPEKRKKKDSDAGYIKLRCRYATQEDIESHGGEKAIKSMGGSGFKSFFKNPIPVKNPFAAAPSPSSSRRMSGSSSEKLDIFIQIVSCKNLIIGDIKTSDPYVKICVGDKDYHSTAHVKETLNPEFDPAKHNSTFTFSPSLGEIEQAGGIKLRVKDWDMVGTNDELGYCVIPPETILKYIKEATMDLRYFQLKPPSNKIGEHAGTIQIRMSSAASAPALVGESASSAEALLGSKDRAVDDTADPAADAAAAGEYDKDAPFVVQIISCRGLLIGDRKSSDPYVKIKLGDKDLHKTKTIMKTLDPVYSEETHNFYFCDKKYNELAAAGGLLFKVKDWDRLDKDDDLGSLQLSTEMIHNVLKKGKEDRLEFPWVAPPNTKKKNASGVVGDPGFVTLSIRRATATEIRTYAKKKEKSSGLNPMKMFKKESFGLDYGPPDLHILVEIVSCRGLLKKDLTGSDPYVKVKLAGKDIHETAYISNTSCPIYTVKEKCFFIIDVTTEQLKEVDGIELKVKDYDFGSFSGDELGLVQIPAKTLMEGKGERLEFELEHPDVTSSRRGSSGSKNIFKKSMASVGSVASTVSSTAMSTVGIGSSGKDEQAGYIVIRCRPATAYDREFLKNVTGDGVKSTEFLGYGRDMRDIKSKGTSKAKFLRKDTKKEHGVQKFKVRPHSDPENPDKTEWMTKAEIHTEALKPSKKWLDISCGTLGQVYVEIIGCDGLPNLDTNLGGGNVTDPFAAVVFEDSVVKTDIIDDCLSPRWLPWMQRAFIFRFRHISSNLYVGVFDYDAGDRNLHDLVGRVSVDLTKLRPETEYLLEYNLYKNSFRPEREAFGTITLRVRIEIGDAKAVVMSNLSVPPTIYCSVSDRKDFKMMRNVLQGDEDMHAFDVGTLTFYVNELLANTELSAAVMSAAETILFWRGQVPVFGIYLPLHSVILFLSGIILAEKPYLMPSFYFFGIAWVLLGIQNYRNNLPNPWCKTKGFEEIILMAAMNKNLGPQSIDMHENEEATVQYEKEQEAKLRAAEALRERRNEKYMEMLKEHEEMMGDIDDTAEEVEVSTQNGPGALGAAAAVVNPIAYLKPILYPIQQYLCLACQWLRFIKNVFIWEEPYYATMLSIGSIAIGMVFFLIPWRFILTWTTRLVVWLLLGPHMKLVDIYWYSQRHQTDAEFEAETKAQLAAQLENQQAAAEAARIAHEDAVKLKAMKIELFGKYITEVPLLRFDRFLDTPLFTSMAKPYTPPRTKTRAVSERVAGQHLVGSMIPRLEDTIDATKDPVEKKNE